MIVEVVQLHLIWPDEVSIFQLRTWLLSQVQSYGRPLRWAITSVQPGISDGAPRNLILEAVITRDDNLKTENNCD